MGIATIGLLHTHTQTQSTCIIMYIYMGLFLQEPRCLQQMSLLAVLSSMHAHTHTQVHVNDRTVTGVLDYVYKLIHSLRCLCIMYHVLQTFVMWSFCTAYNCPGHSSFVCLLICHLEKGKLVRNCPRQFSIYFQFGFGCSSHLFVGTVLASHLP